MDAIPYGCGAYQRAKPTVPPNVASSWKGEDLDMAVQRPHSGDSIVSQYSAYVPDLLHQRLPSRNFSQVYCRSSLENATQIRSLSLLIQCVF